MWKQIDKKKIGDYITKLINREIEYDDIIVANFENLEMYDISEYDICNVLDMLDDSNLLVFVKSKTVND